MIAYTTIGTNDMEKAKAFYLELLSDLNVRVLVDVGRLALIGSSMSKPMLAVCLPYNKEPANPGNGNMIAIPAGSRDNVDALYAKAISLGATCDGKPGERLPNFYGAYIHDLDGNKLAFIHMG